MGGLSGLLGDRDGGGDISSGPCDCPMSHDTGDRTWRDSDSLGHCASLGTRLLAWVFCQRESITTVWLPTPMLRIVFFLSPLWAPIELSLLNVLILLNV